MLDLVLRCVRTNAKKTAGNTFLSSRRKTSFRTKRSLLASYGNEVKWFIQADVADSEDSDSDSDSDYVDNSAIPYKI